MLFLTPLQCLEVIKSSFQVILRGVFVFYTPGGLCRKQGPWSKFCVVENRQELCRFLHSFSAQKSLKAVSSCFQVILRGVFIFYTAGGLCRKQRPWSKFCVVENRQELCRFLHSFSAQKSSKAVSSRFQVILRGVFIFYTPEGLCRKGRPRWSKFCIIEDIVVSYTSKLGRDTCFSIFRSDFEGGLCSWVLGLRFSFSTHPVQHSFLGFLSSLNNMELYHSTE